MKKIVSLFLVVSLVLVFAAACGANDQTSTSATTATTAAQTTTLEQLTTHTSATTQTTVTTQTSKTTQTSQTTQATTTATVTPPPAINKAEPNSLVFHIDFAQENLVDNSYYTDLSGNGHVAYIKGNVPNVDGGVKFSGSSSSYIYIKNHTDLNFYSTSSFTLVVRFKAEPKSQWSCIAQKGLGDNTAPYYGFWLDSGNKLNMGVAASGTKNFASDDVIDTEWHQAIMIQDAKAGTILFYLDGELQSSTFPKNNAAPATPQTVSSPAENFTIGTNFSDNFTGIVDDIKLYNYAVPEKELLTDFPGQVFNLDREYYEYTDSETGESFTLPYRVYYPTGYNADDGKKYPVLLTLHGHGECGKDNVGQLRNSGGYIEYLMARNDCIVIAPQCQCDNGVNKEWVASNHHFELTDREYTEKATLALRAVMSLMDQVKADTKVDTDRIYAFGFSMGGFGVWELLIRQPDTFAAAIILSAAGIPSMADKVLDIDIRAYHGRADKTVPVSGLELMDAAITALGGTKFTASYFDGIDHNGCMGAANAQDGDIFAWLLAQTKAD